MTAINLNRLIKESRQMAEMARSKLSQGVDDPVITEALEKFAKDAEEVLAILTAEDLDLATIRNKMDGLLRTRERLKSFLYPVV